jgi:uncharacterized protein YfaS (alpha-2-macroglobulin family)
MFNKQFLSYTFILLLVCTLFSCKKAKINAEKNPYVFANTSGVISKNQPIKVVFANNMVEKKSVGGYVESDAFTISPSVEGKAIWQDEKTLIFKPTESLESNKSYDVSINIGKIHDNVPGEFKNFNFSLQTIKQDYSVQWNGWETVSSSDYAATNYKGKILTADADENKNIESIVKPQTGNVKWAHSNDGLTHDFVISGLNRNNSEQKIKVELNGESISVPAKSIQDLKMAPIGTFEVHDIFFNNEDDFYFIVNFSDPILTTQDLAGLITIQDYDQQITYAVQGNNIKVFPATRITGNQTVNVSPSIKNTHEEALGKPWSKQVNFMDTKPAVRFVNKGNIMPENDGLILPFEAINLNAIDIEVVKIYSNNILQYYQTYSGYEDDYDVNRVGNIVLQQKIQLSSLNSAINKSSWVKYGLDLNKLITTDKNAIYQIRLGFRNAYSTYNCTGDKVTWEEKALEPMRQSYDEPIESFYDNNYNGFATDFSYDDYNYEDRNNPCKSMYYSKEHFAVQSVYKSSIGLIAKGNDQGEFFSVTTDLITAKALGGAEVTYYDYQQQVINKGSSDGDGILKVKLDRKPFMVIAEKGGEKSYLLLDDGKSLSLSKFDVTGEEYQKGLKAYLYAERGVWRPGDSIFLNCIIEDKASTLPVRHPIQLEWRDPRNVVVSKTIFNYKKGEIIPMHLATTSESPTGVWAASVKVGGATFTKLLNVETIKPNRLKINFEADKGSLMAGTSSVSAKLNSTWLIGTVAANLRAVIDANLRSSSTPFPSYEDFAFINEGSDQSFQRTVFDGNTDDGGNANLTMQINPNEDIKQISKVVFKTTVFEPGGNFSIDYTTGTYSPYKTYVGVKLPSNQWGEPTIEEGKNADITGVALNQFGKPISNVNMTVTIYKVDWRWWWEGGYSDASYYTGNFNSVPIKTITKKTGTNGKVSMDFKPSTWGRYFVKVTSDASPHTTGSFFYSGYPDYASLDQMANIATSLPLGMDKKTVKIGEDINLSFSSPSNSRALITIENGNSLVSHQWVDCKEGANKISIKTTDEMGSNCYAFVTLIQPHNQSGNDLPLRMYGVLPFKIENPGLILKPVLEIPGEIQPDKKVDFTVSEKDGKAMSYTIAIVDEGLLDITKFKTPNPYDHFYAKSALAIRTWDLFDYVIGAYGGRLANIFAVGGDMAAAQVEGAPKANRFIPAVVNLGPFILKKGEKAKHSFSIPNYMGSVRAMVVACNEKAFGSINQSIKVIKPLMVSTTLPRVLSPGETFNVPVNVFVTKSNIRDVKVNILDKSNNLIPQSASGQNLVFEGPGEKMLYFPVSVGNKEGRSIIQITAESGKELTRETIEIEVRNPNMPITVSKDYVIAAGQSMDIGAEKVGMDGTNTTTLEFSTFPSMNIAKNLDQLIDYPYGCLEQTISKAFPQLFLNDVVPLTQTNKDKIKSMVDIAISKISNFQNSEGWFSYWPGSDYVDQYTSNYAGHFMIEAKKAGYNIPQGTYDSWLNNQKKIAKLWQPKQLAAGLYAHNADIDQAYRLYTLALAGSPELGSMNQLKELKTLSNPSKFYLAASYAIIGKKDVSKALLAQANKDVPKYAEFGYTFGSDLRDQAILLNALVSVEDKLNAANVAKSMATKMGSGSWYATYSLSYGLWSVAKYLKKYPPSSGINATYTMGGKAISLNETKSTYYVQFGSKQNVQNSKIVNKGSGVLYVTMVQKGKPALTDQTKQADNISVSINYTDKNGNALNPANIKKGTEFYTSTTVTNISNYSIEIQELALTQIFPSGWEIVNDRMQEGMIDPNNGAYYDYADIRDDRVNYFFDLRPSSSKTFKTKLIAAYSGKSFVPATTCSAMYNNTVSARVPGMWVAVE